MKFIKNNLKVIIAFVLGAILTGGIVYAAVSASQIEYTTNKNANVKSVEEALNDLYNKTNKTPQAVATLTTQGATYTMQNDGYITGTAGGEVGSASIIFLNEKKIVIAPWDDEAVYDVSVYVEKNTVVRTRSDGGKYNLNVYEFK